MKKGISLIVLVITIIVMIILAASVVLTLSNTGIINRATEATESTNLKNVQQLATLIWSEAYLDKTPDLNADYIKDKLEDEGINTDNYEIIVGNGGVTVTLKPSTGNTVSETTAEGVPIPVGFVKSPYEGEGTKAGGLVIYALTETEIANGVTDIRTIDASHQVSMETRNQFVWVPVNNFKTEFARQSIPFSWGSPPTLSSVVGEGYWELQLDGNNMPVADQATTYISEKTLSESIAMYNSVSKYGGFYMGRYEVGAKNIENDETMGYIGTSEFSITMGKYPYADAFWGASMTNEELAGSAITIARNFYPETNTNYGAVSTLAYGAQWDRTMVWWTEQDASIDLADSTSYGLFYDSVITTDDLNENAKYSVFDGTKYSTWAAATSRGKTEAFWLMTTGAYKKASVLNIYDMAGSLREWTMEAYSTNMHVVRGGHFYYQGDGDPIISRLGASLMWHDERGYGARVALYVK